MNSHLKVLLNLFKASWMVLLRRSIINLDSVGEGEQMEARRMEENAVGATVRR